MDAFVRKIQQRFDLKMEFERKFKTKETRRETRDCRRRGKELEDI